VRTLLWLVLLPMTAAASDEAWRDGRITEVAQSEAPLLCPALMRAELEGLVQRM
jgi:hypothetical protein